MDTTRYILHYDVPFLVLPSRNPISLPWLALGVAVGLVALVAVLVPVIVLTVILALPVFVSRPRRQPLRCCC